jgi:5-methylcytosine-specific restriction endonuclease McrA
MSENALSAVEKTREYKKRWYEAHKAQVIFSANKWHSQNKEKSKAIKERWRINNPDKVKEAHSRYQATHQTQIIERVQQWQRQHMETHKARCRRYYAIHKDFPEFKALRAEREKHWVSTHRKQNRAKQARRRATKLASPGSQYTTGCHIAARWAMWGNRCWICGKPANATDHVKPLVKGGAHFPSNLRPICTSCNAKKGSLWNGVLSAPAGFSRLGEWRQN